MSADTQKSERSLFLATAAAAPKDRRIALVIAAASALVFLASAPFARVYLGPLPAFIPFYQSAVITNDLITAVLLFAQFSILRSRAMLLLGSAYLFTSCVAMAHTLSFPGLFPSSVFAGGPQTTAWLYMIWHGGFPLLIIAYALSKNHERDSEPLAAGGRFDVWICVASVLTAAALLAGLAIAGQRFLPAIMDGSGYTAAMLPVAGAIATLSLTAAAVVWLRRSQTALDLWLMVSMWALALDIGLSAILNSGRFDLGFYAGRACGLVATGLVLIVLLIENTRLYGMLVDTYRSDRAKAAELRRLATLDPLTRIANRRAFEETLDREWRRALRYGTPLCLLMIDVDFFKRYNDRYGHVAGDQCLRAVAQTLASFARRGGDLAARYGGEEFAIVLPQVDARDAHALAERLCEEIRALDIPHETSDAANHVTISVGLVDAVAVVAAVDRAGERDMAQLADPRLLIEQADAALYAAKAAGRNQVSIATAQEALQHPQPQPVG